MLWFMAAAVVTSSVAAASVVGVAVAGSGLADLVGLAVTAGVLAGATTALICAWLRRARARRRTGPKRTGREGTLWAWVLVLCGAVLVSVSWLAPGPGIQPELVAGAAWLERPDGSRLAYHVTRALDPSEPPVVVVHGGPGVADMAHDVPAFAGLATDRDVWVYDQIGAGASTRLSDPVQYSTARAVEDLEAIRILSRADRIVLLGHSWGARIAASYVQRHPGHVAALVFSAPGDLPTADRSQPGDLGTRLDWPQRLRLYGRLAAPRNLFTYALTAADLTVAHRFAADQEMDRRFAAIYAASTPALFCDQRLASQMGTTGVGFYAHYAPQLHPDLDDQPVDIDTLQQLRVPVLLIKPACDYLPWSSTAGYRQAFPQARFVMLPDAGHAAYLEQPARYLKLVDAFLAGRPLPLPILTGDEIPTGYCGTR